MFIRLIFLILFSAIPLWGRVIPEYVTAWPILVPTL